MGDDAPRDVFLLGDLELPPQVDLALICSVSCPGSVIIKTYDAIRSLREAGVVIAGGFHSPMERECLDYLLRGQQAVVLSPAFGIDWLQSGEVEQRALKEDRLMVVSIAGSEVTKATCESALLRNTFVAALADAVFVPHAVPGGQAELTARLRIGDQMLTEVMVGRAR